MAYKLKEMVKRNVVTAFILVALPLLAALIILGIFLFKGYQNAWGYGFVAILVAIIIEYPYLKICDRYFFK